LFRFKKFSWKSNDKFYALNQFLKDLDNPVPSKSILISGYRLTKNGISKTKRGNFGCEDLFISPPKGMGKKRTVDDIEEEIKRLGENLF
jgi:hypothetical protein